MWSRVVGWAQPHRCCTFYLSSALCPAGDFWTVHEYIEAAQDGREVVVVALDVDK